MADACEGHCIAVNDAYRLFPNANALYAGDGDWWDVHRGVPGFAGEKWTSHDKRGNDNLARAERYGLNLILGRPGEGFSANPSVIHYGSNSGFQAINLAILFGATRIILVGFDMTASNRKRHFFGDHPEPLGNTAKYESFIPEFRRAAKRLPPHIEIINATPDSRLDCFPRLSLSEALHGSRH